jgi:hypothetical protein
MSHANAGDVTGVYLKSRDQPIMNDNFEYFIEDGPVVFIILLLRLSGFLSRSPSFLFFLGLLRSDGVINALFSLPMTLWPSSLGSTHQPRSPSAGTTW